MAHELTMTSGRAEMAYVGEVPWHGLGQRLQEGASIEEWEKAAGMGWTIRRAPVMYYADRAQQDLRKDDGNVVLLRSDTGNRLGIVSPDYKPVQPREVLEFFRDLVENAGFQLHTAGTMFGGSKFWALAKITEAMVSGWDRIGGFLLLATSADGSIATTAQETAIRVVCNNTITTALNRQERRVVRVSHRMAFDEKLVKAKLGLGEEHFAAFVEAASALTKIRVTEAAAEQFVLDLLRKPPADDAEPEEDEEQDERMPRGYYQVLELFSGTGLGSTRPGSKGTAWGLVNAVTEYVDHLATARSVDHRLQRAWFGGGADIKATALERALQLA